MVATGPDARTVVVGGGPAGLAVAACLRRRGVEPLILDEGSEVGESWQRRYDRLHLHTPRVQSALPGLPIPRGYGRWVCRDDMVAYLRAYADHHDLRPQLGVQVRRLVPRCEAWMLETTRGPLQAGRVVVATGNNRVPHLPEWPGREGFPRPLLHAAEYRNASPFVGMEVLVVGAGNSGAEIAADLAESGAAAVLLAVRAGPNVVPRQVGPVPTTLLGISQDYLPARLVDPVNHALQRRLLGDLTAYGLPAPSTGVVAQARATGAPPTIDVGLVEQLRAGRVRVVAAVARFDGDVVVLADGTRVAPDAVIAATGYTCGLDPLVGHLGVLDERGWPLVRGAGEHRDAPGLRFVGLRPALKGALLQINLEARSAAAALAREGRTARAVCRRR